MIEPIFEHLVVPTEQGRGDRQVGGIAAAEQQCAVAPAKLGQATLALVVQAVMAVDQVRGAAADTVLVDGLFGRLTQCWMVRQPEVIVAAERNDRATVDDGFDTLRRLERPSLPVKPGGTPCIELVFEGMHRVGGSGRGVVVPQLLAVGDDAESIEQLSIPVLLGIRRGQQGIAVKDRIGAGEKTQRLQFIGHLGTSG